jgi:hypothetical protein
MNGALAEQENSALSTGSCRKTKKSDDPRNDPETYLKMNGYTLFLKEKRQGTKIKL